MKKYPEVQGKFATAVLEELALLRAEMISQRSLLIELLSRITKERRRQIKDRLYDKRITASFRIAPMIRKTSGLPKTHASVSRGHFEEEAEE